MAMNTGPTDGQGIGGEVAGGDRGTGGIDRAEEARVGDVGSPHPVEQPEAASETEADVALGGGVPSGEAPNTGRQPGPTGTAVDDETNRTDLDMDEPFEGFGVPPWRSAEVPRDEAEDALRDRAEDEPDAQ
jgi:hypothetical protein